MSAGGNRENLDQEDLDRLDHTVKQVLAAARAEERGRVAPRKLEGVEVVSVLEDSAEKVREQHGLAPEAIRLSGARVAWVRSTSVAARATPGSSG